MVFHILLPYYGKYIVYTGVSRSNESLTMQEYVIFGGGCFDGIPS